MKAFYSFPLLFLPSLVSATPSDLTTIELDKRACTPFKNPLTNASGCCDIVSAQLFWVDILLGIGVCCPIGQVLEGFNCVTPSSGGSVCSGKAVCANKTGVDLGIKYGHCYVLLSLNNNYLGHDNALKYVVMGENPGVVFRVCGDTTTCTTSADQYVPVNGTWYMQDQMGDPNGSGFAWLGGAGDLNIVNSTDQALAMGGSSTCFGGNCAICITFPPGGAHAPCPLTPGQSHLGIAANPNSCQNFYWQEVSCRSENQLAECQISPSTAKSESVGYVAQV
ncbi:conserved hypothetical protein [Talaromyces stipitatus ATCC 10500]|uniref:Uncharacterized protein n=1 Tax=Talaromyces stipitatus (strain ATCC 10500 / CBS 375.48 / QM 6759 / NRRL 1006) TaxID=441959 RepID=B8MAT3_TALSN|nr:uncharacterized protein TSTA_115680 [Talaromyces stipitatus ATCC 10500]EED17773.1 conserved hypothetical protein [Talaromyces stipitatus ATCC 10500]